MDLNRLNKTTNLKSEEIQGNEDGQSPEFTGFEALMVELERVLRAHSPAGTTFRWQTSEWRSNLGDGDLAWDAILIVQVTD